MKKRILSLLVTIAMVLSLLPTTALAAGTYTDTNGHWAEEAIDRWSGHGVIQGNNGKFNPGNHLTRAHMAAILSRLLNLPEAEAAGFRDVKAADWYADAVNKCAAAGIMLGNDGYANPNAPITRQQAVVMLARALCIEPAEKADLSGYTDAGQVSAYAMGYLAAMAEAGIVKGTSDTTLSPGANITRAATVTILDRAITGYIKEAGEYDLDELDTTGIVLVASDDVKLSGEVKGTLFVAQGAAGSTVSLKDVSVKGKILIGADGVVLTNVASGVKVSVADGVENAKVNGKVVKSELTVSGGGSSGGGSGSGTSQPVTPPAQNEVSATQTVEVADGKVKEEVAIEVADSEVQATVPAGVAVEDGKTALTLTVAEKSETDSNITVNEDEESAKSYDVHIDGVAKTNTQAIVVELGAILSEGMNIGNVKLYHVEDGAANIMTQVQDKAELDAHNEFYYDPVTGKVSVAMASFSEVAVVSDTENAWEGNFDYSWYTNVVTPADGEAETEYIIANADQLAAFGAIVGGMNGQTQDSFAGKTVKLIADINLGDAEESNTEKIFHPIGYYYTDDKNNDGTIGDYYSTVNSFKGTFDGNGHTIANFYQNTWEIKGDYDGNYYKDAMGLFGYVVGGTVKNLTVDNFSSDGEYTPTGVIAAYAEGDAIFENIAITNCNPRVYNTGNGGIIGVAGDTSAANDDHITLKNITVDNSNKISALWGSWDVACGGLVGMYRGNVDGSGNATGDTIRFENCHVAAQIDVYNDVCANYQYYAYRYAGMMIGSIRHNTKNDEGRTIPNMAGISASGCTVNYGDWNDYYYCEFEKNTMASYSEDYQFSRVPHSELNFTDSNGNGVVDADERASVTGCKHSHTAEENHQAIYLPFHQLFTGYSWGVSSIGLEKYSGIVTNLDITEGDQEESVEKFETKFTGDFLYRVGNQNAVALGSLFAAKNGMTISDSGVVATIEAVDENSNVSGTFTADTTDWTQGTIQFSGTGVVKVTIQDYNFCTPTELIVEVMDATNITSATGTTSGGNFVLLCDVNASNYVYYWNSTLYGNGFTYSLNGAPTSYSSSHGHGILITKNATLDNLVLVGDVYDEYGAYTTNNDYNAAIDVLGETVIQNCYISGCSAPVSTRANATIKNTTLYGGAVGNLIIKGGTVTLENVTTANYDDGRELVGMGIVVHSDAAEDSKLVLNGTLTQYNFIKESDTPSNTYAKNLHTTMFSDSCSQYHFSDGTDTYVNTGVISLTTTFDSTDITDNANTGYVGQSVSASGFNGYVYTQPNTSGSVNNNYDKDTDPNVGTAQGAVPPGYSFDYTTKNYVAKADGSNDYCYEENGVVYISMDDGDSFDWDTSILTVTKGNETLDYTVSMNGTDYTGKSITFNTSGDYEVVYTYTDPNNYKLDENGNITTYSVTYTKIVNISVAVIKATTKHAEFTMGSSNAATEKITIDNATYISATGVTADNSTWTYMTINGQNIYYPIVAAKLTSTKGSSTYAYFPVFENVVTITDYADGGTGAAVTYNSSTTTLPSGLTAVKGVYNKAASDVTWSNLTDSNLTQSGASAIFKWASSSSAPSDPETYNNVLCYKSPQISANRDAYITLVQYSYTDEANTTYYYYVGYTLEAFTKQTTCVTPDTLVTLADGTQKRIDEATYEDQFLVWDFVNGEYTTAPASILMDHGVCDASVVTLFFEDGTQINTVNGHGFFDVAANGYVLLDETNAADYVGHSFVKQDGESYSVVKLVGYSIREEETEVWSILTAEHYNCILEGMFTLTPAEVDGSPDYLMPFAVGDDMKYDEAAMMEGIEKYGLYTYADFADLCTYEQFEAFNLPQFKVSVAKGHITWDEIMYLLSIHG